jgi:integrase/recombinase XerD
MVSKTAKKNSTENSKKSKNDLSGDNSLKQLISATTKLWRKYHLTYDQARYVGKEVRRELSIKRAKNRKTVMQRLSREEEQKLINQAYRDNSQNGLLLKTLFLTGARCRVRFH